MARWGAESATHQFSAENENPVARKYTVDCIQETRDGSPGLLHGQTRKSASAVSLCLCKPFRYFQCLRPGVDAELLRYMLQIMVQNVSPMLFQGIIPQMPGCTLDQDNRCKSTLPPCQ